MDTIGTTLKEARILIKIQSIQSLIIQGKNQEALKEIEFIRMLLE
jgi:hypothetical protein